MTSHACDPGIASGHAVSRGGDWYGRAVNHARRVTGVAPPGASSTSLRDGLPLTHPIVSAGLPGMRKREELFDDSFDDNPDDSKPLQLRARQRQDALILPGRGTCALLAVWRGADQGPHGSNSPGAPVGAHQSPRIERALPTCEPPRVGCSLSGGPSRSCHRRAQQPRMQRRRVRPVAPAGVVAGGELVACGEPPMR